MKFRMHPNSLFAVLLRSPWWASFAIAAGIFVVARFFLPDAYAAVVPLPFLAIGAYAAYRQLQAPSGARVARVLEAARAMSWSEFSRAVEEAFRRQGYNVNRLEAAGADFELTNKLGRVSLVSCKRWKVARAGIEPLRDLSAAKDARDAHECIFITTGEITDTARKFAAKNSIRLVHEAELAKLLPRIGRPGKGSG